MLFRFVTGISIALLSSAFPEAALAQPNERAPVLHETLDVRMIELDAIVTNRSDEPILDLGPADFDLRFEGKKVEVTSVATGRELRETVGGRLTIVVVVDERNISPVHRQRALTEIAKAVSIEVREHPTWVAGAALGETGIEPLFAPTRDSAKIEGLLQATRPRPLTTNELQRQQRNAVQSVRDMLRSLTKSGSAYRVGEASKASVAAEVRSYGAALSADTRRTISDLALLVEALSFVPGRKAVLLLSDGLPRNPLDLLAKTMYDRLAGGTRQYSGDDLTTQQASSSFNDPSTRPTGSDRADNSRYVRPDVQVDDGGAHLFQDAVSAFSVGGELDRLSALANTHRVTFYPLKPPVVDPTISSLDGSDRQRGAITILTDMRSGLESLAEATGGLSFAADSGVEDFLAQTRDDLSAYYSLGFTPPDSMAGSGVREMVLKVRRRKTRVRYRASYLPLTLSERLASRAWGTLLFDWQENLHGLEVEVAVGNAEQGPLPPEELDPAEVGWRRVDFLLSLPIRQLSLLPTGENVVAKPPRRSSRAGRDRDSVASGAFRAVFQLRRSDGARLEPEHTAFQVTIPTSDLEQARDQYFAVRTALRLPSGRYDLAVGLWEESSGKSSFVLRSFAVGAEGPEVAIGPSTLEPFCLAAKARPEMVRRPPPTLWASAQ